MAKERVRVNKQDDKDEDNVQDQTETTEAETEDKADPADEEEETEKTKPKSKAKAKQPEPEDEDEDDAEETTPSYTKAPIGARVTQLAGTDTAPTVNVEDFDEEETVPMMFPVTVNVQHEGIMHKFEKGIHNVPLSISKHWYLKQNGVKKFKGR